MKYIKTFEQYLFKINEDIYGNKAIVFHRSPTDELINIFYNKEYKFGKKKGSFYGDGLYTTFDMDSQLKDKMKKYGDYIFKISVDIKDFLVLEYNEFIKHPNFKILGKPNKDEFIIKQLESKKLQNIIDDETNVWIDGWEAYVNLPDILNSEYSSKIAYFLSNVGISEFYDGMIFRGQNDGNVLVIFSENFYNNVNILGFYHNDEYTVFDKLYDKTSKEYAIFKNNLNKNINSKENTDKYYFYLSMIKKDLNNINLVPKNYKRYLELCKEGIEFNVDLFSYIADDFVGDYEFYESLLSKNGKYLSKVPENIKDKKLCMLAFEDNYINSFIYFKDEYKSFDVCLSAVSYDGYLLKYVPKDIENYYEIVKRAYDEDYNIIFQNWLDDEYKQKLRKDFPKMIPILDAIENKNKE